MDKLLLNAKIATLDIPERIKRLPISPTGFPCPWFVQWFDDAGKPTEFGVGTPDFRCVDTRKLHLAIKSPRCWICGEFMGVHRVFTIGPMCSINRVISEPPAHRDCAEFAVKACPFLANPRMRRNEVDLPEKRVDAAGMHIARNPGAACLWETRDYKPIRAEVGKPGVLFQLGDPVRVDWYCEGRQATRAEVIESIETGYPQLQAMARKGGFESLRELHEMRVRAWKLLPA